MPWNVLGVCWAQKHKVSDPGRSVTWICHPQGAHLSNQKWTAHKCIFKWFLKLYMHLWSKRGRFLNMQQLSLYLNSSGKLKAKPLKLCQILQREFIKWAKIEKVYGNGGKSSLKKNCSYLFEQDEMSFKTISKPNQSGIPWISHGNGV